METELEKLKRRVAELERKQKKDKAYPGSAYDLKNRKKQQKE